MFYFGVQKNVKHHPIFSSLCSMHSSIPFKIFFRNIVPVIETEINPYVEI
jgi:hypothetical protein